jgi:hypothetical protein
MATEGLRQELNEKEHEELAALCIANGLITAIEAASAPKQQLIALLMQAADKPLPPEGEVGAN